jgi:hypothetical protein
VYETERERGRGCVCVRERGGERVCVRERGGEGVCERQSERGRRGGGERERVCVCVCGPSSPPYAQILKNQPSSI